MIIKRIAALMLAVLAVGSLTFSAPLLAHKDHEKKPAAAAARPGATPGSNAVVADPTAMHAGMGEMMEDGKEARAKLTPLGRLLDWLGRLHPVIVHFPIAFFPAALFTAIVGRKRPAFAQPVQFLVIAGGTIAPVAALLGWFDAGFAPGGDEALLQVHRWLGTAIGLGALVLAVWAWRRPGQDRSPTMIAALAAITVAIVIQGWFGGALVHGMDHMNW